jgi:hypothetical protein
MDLFGSGLSNGAIGAPAWPMVLIASDDLIAGLLNRQRRHHDRGRRVDQALCF